MTGRELLVTGATLVDVVTLTSYHGWFTVAGGRFVEVEEGDPSAADLAGLEAERRLELGGAWVQPGMIDAHMHIESSLVTPRRFAEAALPRGTTTVLQDPHEVANVLGAAGIRWMIESARGLPLRVYAAISSCVPATGPDIETPNAGIAPAEVVELAREPEVIALGEVMDFQGLVEDDAHLVAMVDAAVRAGLSVEGHVPTLSGIQLSRYAAHGVRSDHTLATPAKLREQLRKGMCVMIQQKSLTPEVVEAIVGLRDRSRVMLVTDDVMPNRLPGGHMDRLVRRATELGWDVLDAIAAATLRPAGYLALTDLGLLAPGARADFLVCDGPAAYPPRQVYVGGVLVAEGGVMRAACAPGAAAEPAGLRPAFALGSLVEDDFRLDAGVAAGLDGARGRSPQGAGARSRVRARVIVVQHANSLTGLEEREVELDGGVPTDPDLALATVLPRAALRPGAAPYRPVVGLVARLGLRRGGFATSFAHDSHNVFVLGRAPRAMLAALERVVELGGAMAFAPGDGRAPVVLPLPLAGLLSDDPVAEVGAAFEALERELRAAGMTVEQPVLLLTLLPLSVSPDYKITDRGVVDVRGRRILTPLVDA